MPVLPTHAAPPYVSQLAPVALWGLPYNQLTEEEKAQAWFTGGDMQASLRGGQLHTVPPGISWRTARKGCPPSGPTSNSGLGIRHRHTIMYQFVANGTWEGHDGKIGNKEAWVSVMWIDVYE